MDTSLLEKTRPSSRDLLLMWLGMTTGMWDSDLLARLAQAVDNARAKRLVKPTKHPRVSGRLGTPLRFYGGVGEADSSIDP